MTYHLTDSSQLRQQAHHQNKSYLETLRTIQGLFRIILILISLIILPNRSSAQIVIKDSVSITPKLNSESVISSSLASEAPPTVSITIRFQCQKNENNVRILHSNNCTGGYDVDAMVNNNSTYTNTFSAPSGQAGISFYYYAWEVDSNPPLRYLIDAVVSATGQTYHSEGELKPRPLVGSGFLSAGINITLPYMTSFEFTLWDIIEYYGSYNFSTAYSMVTPPTGFKTKGRFYAYNDRCGTTYWFPNTEPMDLTITTGGEYAAFYDKSTGIRLGTRLSRMFSTLGAVKLIVDDIPQERVAVTIQATGGTVTKSQTTYIPGYPLDSFRVAVMPDSIFPGNETTISITPLDKNGDVLTSQHYIYISSDDSAASAKLELRYPPETGWANVSVPANSQLGLMNQYSQLGYLYYIADTTHGQGNKKIAFTVQDSYNSKRTGSGTVVVKGKKELCPVVSIVPSRIKAGETAEVIVKGKNESGIAEDYPVGTQFTFTITSGAKYGAIVGNSSPAQFIASENIDVDEAVVSISAAVGNSSAMTKSQQQTANVAAPMCEVSVGSVTVEDKCPSGTECSSSEPGKPKTAVSTKGSGEISGEILDCSLKTTLGQFKPIFSLVGIEFDANGVSVCCDNIAKKWVLQMPSITFNSVIGLCENNLQEKTDLATENLLLLSNTDKCRLKKQLTESQTTYPLELTSNVV